MSKQLLLMCLLHGFAAQSLTVDELVRVAVLAALRDWAGETVLLAGCMVCHHVGCCVLLRLCCIAAYCACCCMLLLVLWSWWCRRSGVACAWRVTWTLARCWVVAPEGARRGSKAVCVSHFYLFRSFFKRSLVSFTPRPAGHFDVRTSPPTLNYTADEFLFGSPSWPPPWG